MSGCAKVHKTFAVHEGVLRITGKQGQNNTPGQSVFRFAQIILGYLAKKMKSFYDLQTDRVNRSNN